MTEKLIIVGKAASGKDHLKQMLKNKMGSEVIDISYTTRKRRENETDGIEYHFSKISKFAKSLINGDVLQFNVFGDKIYWTDRSEWLKKKVFIMSPNGVESLKKEDRESCFVLFLDTEKKVRMERLRKRNISGEEIENREKLDSKEFDTFVDYDYRFTSDDFKSLIKTLFPV